MKRKNILIAELIDTHGQFLITLMNLFNQNKSFNPFALITERNYKKSKQDFPDFYLKNQSKVLRYKSSLSETKISILGLIIKMIYRIRQLIETIQIIKKKNIDVICVNSIQTKKNLFMALYLLFTRKKFALLIHEYVFANKTITDKIYSSLMRRVIKRSSFLFFLADYLKEDKCFKDKKKIYINFIYDQNPKKFKKYDKITFSILGVPIIGRRDYELVFKSFSQLINKYKDQHLSDKIKIVIPLKIKSKEIFDLVKEYKIQNLVELYDHYVPEEKYTEILKRSHYSIMPPYSDKDCGEKKISASFAYGCAYMTPMIVTSQYLKYNRTPKPYVYLFNPKDDSFTKIIEKLIFEKYKPSLSKKQFEGYKRLHSFDHINNQINSILI